MTSLLSLARRPARNPILADPKHRNRGAIKTTTATTKAPHLDTPAENVRPRPSLTTLPPEIHLLIAQNLIYPDALSLKHTNRYFYQLVDTGVQLKVEWLMERRMLHLECPNNQRCDLGSDLRFCRGSVKLLMQRRREHMECESRPGLGCLIYGTQTCPHARKLKTRLKKWTRGHIDALNHVRWLLLVVSLLPLLVGWVWMVGAMVF
ncbi:hypothetical protein VTK26DRAFT_834 [Humicola hyalothermophila]